MGVASPPPLLSPMDTTPSMEINELEKMEVDRPHNYDEHRYEKVARLINKETTSYDDLAREVVGEACRGTAPLNLMMDSVLHEVIAKRKTGLAFAIVALPDASNHRILRHQNYYGDTPLHIAAEIGDSKVAKALLERDGSLAHKKNKKGETPLHKAVQFGHLDVFKIIIDAGGDEMASVRTGDGSTILHYAIMHDQTEEALAIAKKFPDLILSRNAGGASPLQIMAAFYKKSSKPHQTLISHLYASCIEEGGVKSDEESGNRDGQSRGNWWSRLPGWGKCWIVQVINNLRRRKVKEREETSNHEELLKQLVRNEDFGFYLKGFIPQTSNYHSAGDRGSLMRNVSSIDTADHLYEVMREVVKSASRPSDDEVSEASDRRIWEESPLITGVKFGLDDFVIKILQLSPRSATYVGYDGMNVLQAAVKYHRRHVVLAIKEDKRLPTWLFTDLESDTMNTLLHIAASGNNLKKEIMVDPLRLHDELEWFEMLEKIVPKELLNYRNKGQKTAQEVFDEKHKEMLKDCRTELVDIGRTCAPLVAAAVFTSSFYIPGENNRENNRLAFKIFSRVYVVGFSCATTALVLYLLLMVMPYKQRDFRRVVPLNYLMASILLTMSLSTFSIAFACNMYMQIYGNNRKSYADLATLMLELLVVPFIYGFAHLFCGGSGAFWRACLFLKRLAR
ncbi:uncharacterized protein LOC121967084 [Zingiber officinale]|uniref:uncharacterized protein LOC121967084 n=1 Tax=Zingiber officinale TaxID=94328 RepID=UPI001C4CD135|nr:uncharacterized protein LOC121967084 [Zingiber officinale]